MKEPSPRPGCADREFCSPKFGIHQRAVARAPGATTGSGRTGSFANAGSSCGQTAAHDAEETRNQGYGCEGDKTSAQCLVQIRDQVVRILNPDRDANKRRRDAQPQPFFLWYVRMGHRRRMRSERLRTTQAHRELDHLKPIQDGKGFGLTPLYFKAESGHAAEPMVCMTLPWRKPDSNH